MARVTEKQSKTAKRKELETTRQKMKMKEKRRKKNKIIISRSSLKKATATMTIGWHGGVAANRHGGGIRRDIMAWHQRRRRGVRRWAGMEGIWTVSSAARCSCALRAARLRAASTLCLARAHHPSPLS